MGYTKLFSEILMSTVWREPDHVRIVWITMLAAADRDGIVHASIPGLADSARVSIEQCEDALSVLLGPDKYSRTRDHEGRRIRVVDGGWHLLNHNKYREKMNEDERRDYKRRKQQEYRDRMKERGQSVDNSGQSWTGEEGRGQCGHIADSEADSDSEARSDSKESSETPEHSSSVSTPPLEGQVPLSQVIGYWNSKIGENIRCTDTRRKSLHARLLVAYWRDNWKNAIDKIADSSFCCGDNARKWKATIDWLLKPDTLTKVMEGKYDDKKDGKRLI
jgi:hypothetical protein